MRKKISILLCITLILTMFAGCAKNTSNTDTSENENNGTAEVNSATEGETTNVAEAATAEFAQSEEEMFTERDYESSYNESESIRIQLNGTSASASADSVKISGTTITITEEATYVFSGTLNDGRIVVEADDTAKLQIVLNGVNINSENSAALLIFSADKVFVTLADGRRVERLY